MYGNGMKQQALVLRVVFAVADGESLPPSRSRYSATTTTCYSRMKASASESQPSPTSPAISITTALLTGPTTSCGAKTPAASTRPATTPLGAPTSAKHFYSAAVVQVLRLAHPAAPFPSRPVRCY